MRNQMKDVCKEALRECDRKLRVASARHGVYSDEYFSLMRKRESLQTAMDALSGCEADRDEMTRQCWKSRVLRKYLHPRFTRVYMRG